MAASAAPRRSAPLPVENGVRNNKNVWVVFDAPPSPSPGPGIGSGKNVKILQIPVIQSASPTD